MAVSKAVADHASAWDTPIPANFALCPLPGHAGIVFTMYGTPGDLDPVKQLVKVMQQEHLGNGFDPGPTPNPNTKPILDYLAEVRWPVACYPGCADMQ
ncbi:MAG TPA: hypothetical protein VHI52_08430, partial [Verrucomicrobiae bacterium]|nr:hypothetical protein [Verrucomicrobiae bacterium]